MSENENNGNRWYSELRLLKNEDGDYTFFAEPAMITGVCSKHGEQIQIEVGPESGQRYKGCPECYSEMARQLFQDYVEKAGHTWEPAKEDR